MQSTREIIEGKMSVDKIKETELKGKKDNHPNFAVWLDNYDEL